MKKTLSVLMMVLLVAMLIVSCDDSSKKVYKVTFNSKGGSEVAPVEVKEGEKVAKPTDPTKDKYKFGNWTQDEEGKTVYDFEKPVTGNITLYAQWENYEVGDKGPAGGIIFYVNPKASTDGWTYLEAGKADLSGTYQWCAAGGSTNTTRTKTGIGEGKNNTETLATVKDSNETDVSNYQAACAVYEKDLYNNGYTDWFLPSKDELNLMYTELHKHEPALGDFNTTLATPYWSSSEEDTTYSYLQYFNSGSSQGGTRTANGYVRPVRAF